jgi:hypothetical protein
LKASSSRPKSARHSLHSVRSAPRKTTKGTPGHLKAERSRLRSWVGCAEKESKREIRKHPVHVPAERLVFVCVHVCLHVCVCVRVYLRKP